MDAFFAAWIAFYLKKKSVLFCLIFPFTVWFFKVKPILVWLLSTNTYLLVILLAFTCPKGEVGTTVIISRQG